MKRIITIAVFAFTSILAVNKALAQAPGVEVNVPFNFTANDKVLPAGAYTITLESPGVIDIRNRKQHISITSIVLLDSGQSENGGELVFTKYGNRYFLHEMLCDYASMNVHLPTGRSEKWARTQEAMVQNGSQILLAAK